MAVTGSMFSGYTPVQNNNQTLSMIMQLLEKAGSAVGSAAKTGQQNNVANAFMQQGNSGANAPRAGLVDPGMAAPGSMGSGAGTTPAQRAQLFGINNPGVSTAGTQPNYPTNPQGQLMGTPELSMAMQLQKEQAAQAQQNMAMQMHQSQMGLNTTKQNYLNQYGTESPGSNQPRANASQQSEWGTTNNLPPEHVQKDVAFLGSQNELSKRRFGIPINTLMSQEIQKAWVPSDTPDVNHPQKPQDPAAPKYMVNPLLPSQSVTGNSGVMTYRDYNDNMGSISSAWAAHKANRGTYHGRYDDYVTQASGNNYAPSPQQQQLPPTIAGQTGKTQGPPPANQFIQSVTGGPNTGASGMQNPVTPQIQAQSPSAPQGQTVYIQGKPYMNQNGQLVPVQ